MFLKECYISGDLWECLKSHEPLNGVWLIESVIGTGGLSVVFKAVNKDIPELTCAIKVITINRSEKDDIYADICDDMSSCAEDDTVHEFDFTSTDSHSSAQTESDIHEQFSDLEKSEEDAFHAGICDDRKSYQERNTVHFDSTFTSSHSSDQTEPDHHEQVFDFEKKVQLVENEIDILTKCIDCEYIVDIRGRQRIDWKEKTYCLLFMELLIPVEAFFNRENFNSNELLKLSNDICQALVYLEKQGFIHGDIKPRNIFISNSGRYKLGDFGTAGKKGDKIRGYTEAYAAPELHDESKRIWTSTTDIYGIGMTIQNLIDKYRISQKYPQNGGGISNNSDDVQNDGYIYDGFEDIINKACQYDPDKRFQSADEVLNAIEGIKESETYKAGKSRTEERKPEIDSTSKLSRLCIKRLVPFVLRRVAGWFGYTVCFSLIPLAVFFLVRYIFNPEYPYKEKCISELLFFAITLSVVALQDIFYLKRKRVDNIPFGLTLFWAVVVLAFSAVLYGAISIYDMGLLNIMKVDKFFATAALFAVVSCLIGTIIEICKAVSEAKDEFE